MATYDQCDMLCGYDKSPTAVMWRTWANALTAIRALAALPCAWMVATGHWPGAALMFSLAVITDLLDGPLARRMNQSSALGGLIDHATDAAFVTSVLLALSLAGYVHWLLPLLVAAAFTQYMVDSRALRGQRLRGNRLGRANGIGYFVVAAVPIYRNALDLSWPPDPAIAAASWLLIASTLTSMSLRLSRRAATE
ncbi:MAG: CDP-alcohol phosphatidyltransferase family protein [Pseudomonadales bacterium]